MEAWEEAPLETGKRVSDLNVPDKMAFLKDLEIISGRAPLGNLGWFNLNLELPYVLGSFIH